MAKNVARPPTTTWSDIADKPAPEALAHIYAEAIAFSFDQRQWYWNHIARKRARGASARGFSYLFAACGIVAPLVAALFRDADHRLLLTQISLGALALAGLAQLADKVAGWSSGWLRYITTVTAMEKLTLQFELDWVGLLLATPDNYDVKTFFAMAKQLEIEIEKRRSEETDGWVAEFNSGMAALNEMIKFQKDATEKAATAAQTARDTAEQGQQTGALELCLTRGDKVVDPISLSIDDGTAITINGLSWAVPNLAPGIHIVAVASGAAAARTELRRAIEIKANAVAKLDVSLT
jgi:hypothetical protein